MFFLPRRHQFREDIALEPIFSQIVRVDMHDEEANEQNLDRENWTIFYLRLIE
jgi:hypothetical protein